MRAQGQGAGLRQLRQILARMTKGEMGMRLEIWRMSTKMAAYERHRELQAALEAKMRDSFFAWAWPCVVVVWTLSMEAVRPTAVTTLSPVAMPCAFSAYTVLAP